MVHFQNHWFITVAFLSLRSFFCQLTIHTWFLRCILCCTFSYRYVFSLLLPFYNIKQEHIYAVHYVFILWVVLLYAFGCFKFLSAVLFTHSSCCMPFHGWLFCLFIYMAFGCSHHGSFPLLRLPGRTVFVCRIPGYCHAMFTEPLRRSGSFHACRTHIHVCQLVYSLRTSFAMNAHCWRTYLRLRLSSLIWKFNDHPVLLPSGSGLCCLFLSFMALPFKTY